MTCPNCGYCAPKRSRTWNLVSICLLVSGLALAVYSEREIEKRPAKDQAAFINAVAFGQCSEYEKLIHQEEGK